MIMQHGSQAREKLEETEYTLVGWPSPGVILLQDSAGKQEEWVANNHFAGYVIEVGGVGYEFVTSL